MHLLKKIKHKVMSFFFQVGWKEDRRKLNCPSAVHHTHSTDPVMSTAKKKSKPRSRATISLVKPKSRKKK